MRIAFIGGDMRQVYAAELLSQRGHTVTVSSPAASPFGVPVADDVRDAVRDADAVVLPIPVTGVGGAIRGTQELLPSTVLSMLSPGSLLLGGNLSASLIAEARRDGIRTADYLNMESFVLRNAYLTAQAALGILLRELPVCLYRTPSVILGFGRIGKFLARMLLSLGASVTVFARSSSDLAMASLIGVQTKELSLLSDPSALCSARVIVNTAPARLLSREHLSHLSPDTLLLELASGTDNLPTPEEGSRVRLLYAQGLPGKCFPQSAGHITADATEEVLRAL